MLKTEPVKQLSLKPKHETANWLVHEGIVERITATALERV